MGLLLSIAIATKNREKYCVESIKSILSYGYSNLEITIADNSDTEVVKNFVENLNSPQVKYRYDSGPVSSIENFNRAVEMATGEYMMLIGDDDSILPKCMETAKWAKENEVDSICSKETVHYYWPGSIAGAEGGLLSFGNGNSSIKKIDIPAELSKLMKNGIQHYLTFPLPKTYHGLVKMKVMREIKQKTGHFYGGLSPDIYSCIAVSCVAKNHYIIDEPLSVAGVCAKSTTADNIKGMHSGEIEGIPHLKYRGHYEWNERVPKFYSVNTIWAESGIKALEELNQTKLLEEFNVYKLIAQSQINNGALIGNIMKRERELIRLKNGERKWIFDTKVFVETLDSYRKKAETVLSAKINKRMSYSFTDIPNIASAISKYTSVNK